jgi:hypothetical protein
VEKYKDSFQKEIPKLEQSQIYLKLKIKTIHAHCQRFKGIKQLVGL